MKKVMFFIITVAIIVPAWAIRVNSVQVDFLKGYNQVYETNGDTSYCYMGRLTYHLFAEGKDSIGIDFVIVNQTTMDTLVILEKIGDAGLVRQINSGDTVKTVYFRTKLTGITTGSFIATVNCSGQMSHLWKLADSLVMLMSLDQRQSTLYNSPNQQWFGSDNVQIANGPLVVGWRCSDGPHGTRWPIGAVNDIAIYGAGNPATLFPTEAALANTWDTALIYQVGKAIGQESKAVGIYCNLGPMCDLVVNPHWGRAFETMSEDPYLTGKMCAKRILGTQSERVITTPKHFAPYLKEDYRYYGLRVVVSERALRELFCVPFEMAVKEGDARGLMTCYNKVKVPGYTTEDQNLITTNCDLAGTNRHLVDDILRNDWGFNGLILTDWSSLASVGDNSYVYQTNFDMSTPYGQGGFDQISTNVSSNVYTVAPLNKKATNVMYAKLWAWNGRLLTGDNDIKTGYPQSLILSPAHKNVALEAARKSIVLAKNDKVGTAPILPLDKNSTFKLAVVGPYASQGRQGGGGSSAVTPDSVISPISGIKKILAGHSNITLDTVSYTGADVAIVCVGTIAGLNGESEDHDRTNLTLESSQLSLVSNVMASVSRTIVVYTGGSASIAGSWSNAPAVLIALYPGRSQGQALAEILFGDVNPSGHLSVTFPKTEADLPTFDMDLATNEWHYPSVDTGHGYFYYEKTGRTPLFWFGHGLSYATFTYNTIRVIGSPTMSSGDRMDVAVTLTNTGNVAGDQVVQLYVKPTSVTSTPRRVKDLRGFCRVTLNAGETKTVIMTLGARDFSVYYSNPLSKATDGWKIMNGAYELIAGSTSNPAELIDGNGKCVKTTVTIQ